MTKTAAIAIAAVTEERLTEDGVSGVWQRVGNGRLQGRKRARHGCLLGVPGPIHALPDRRDQESGLTLGPRVTWDDA